MKEYIFSCMTANVDIVLYEKGKATHESFTDVIGKDNISVGITEEKLWIILTGYTKKESNLGGAAFELLLEIAKSKDLGINTKDLATATKQDPRSITGRVKKLEGLICSVQMIYKGHVVKLLKLRKYAKLENNMKPYVNIREYLPKIVEIVKHSKNGVRQIIDLKRELKLDVDKRLSKSFIAAINWLTEKGHIKKVLVVSPTNTAVKIRCVKYLKDYIPEDRSTNDFDYETDFDDEASVDFDKTANADTDAYEGLDNFNATNLLQDDNLIVDEKNDTERNKFLLNRFFPVQNQTYDFADSSGLQGVSTMQLINKLTGPDYRRSFTKLTELYVKNVGKQSSTIRRYEIIRVYDFEGKKKFYRFFSGENFGNLTGSVQPWRDVFEPIAAENVTLSSLNKASFVPLSSTVRFIRREDQDIFFWNGELKVPPSVNAPALGRKRKHEEDSTNSLENNKENLLERKVPKVVSIEPSSDFQSREVSSDSLAPKNNSMTKSEVIKVGGFSANSLRSLYRQRAILEVVRQSGGVTYLREQFFEDVSRYMGSPTMLDKKTVRGDVALMVKSHKLHDSLEPKTQRRIIHLPDIDNDAVESYVVKEKDNKRAHFNDIIHNTDIYFFDQTEKDKFHRGKKSVERVRQFQSRSRAHTETGTSSSKSPLSDGNKVKNKTQRRPKKTEMKEGTDALSKESAEPRSRSTFHLGSKDGVEALVMTVVISKSIKNEVAWDQITRLFPNNSLESLKKQWTIRRVKMGHSGWRARVDKWRKILVSAIKDERTTLEEAERLNLPKLIRLWTASELDPSGKPVSLYRNYSENRKLYTFVKESDYSSARIGLAMSSMVQRETSLLKKSYMLDYTDDTLDVFDTDGNTRMLIRSLLFNQSSASRDEILALKKVPKETLDKVVMDMAKDKQIRFSGARLEETGVIQEILESRGARMAFEESKNYREKLEEMLSAKNGIVVSEETSDVASWTLIDLISRCKILLSPVKSPENGRPLSYTTRRFGVAALTPPFIITPRDNNLFQKLAEVPVPVHGSNSRLWIDSKGSIRESVWKNLVSMIIKEVLFNPGIGEKRLLQYCGNIICRQEVREICDWLIAKQLLSHTPFKGYCATSCWYRLME